ncbi:MAG: sigma-70 family RNA polymerase sigma factor [Oscillospiraceae bacterium]
MADALFSKRNLTDEQLVRLAQGGDDGAIKVLVSRYAILVTKKASRYSCNTILTEDLSQEGMFGLLSAVYSFNQNSETLFKTYADKCISNCMLSAVKAYSRKKHLPLNSFISLDSDKLELAESTNPEDIIIASDEVSRMMGTIEKRLSPFERSIVILYLSGKSYSEIASELQISQKSVDNAMQRVHKKLKAKA